MIARPKTSGSRLRDGVHGELSLPVNYMNTTVAGCEPQNPRQRPEEFPPVHNDAMECHSFLRGFERWRAEGAQGARRALQNLLAAGFCFHLPGGPSHSRRSGPDAGFFSYGA